jgi:hypothetical protein
MKSKKSVQGFWRGWRQFRYFELLAAGCVADIAYAISKAEAVARRDLSRIVGKALALSARATWSNATAQTLGVTLELPEDFEPSIRQKMWLWKLGARNVIAI